MGGRTMSEADLKLAKGLSEKVDTALSVLLNLDRYYTSEAPLSFLAPEVQAATQGRLRPLTIPWPRVVVGALEERLDIQGFRIGDSVDDGLWQLWQDSNLDEQSQLAHEEALVHGRSYVMVWVDDTGQPRITVESAKQCYVQHAPGTRRRLAGLKRWVEDGHAHVTLFTPKHVMRFRSIGRVPGDELEGKPGAVQVAAGMNFELRRKVDNPLGVVPLIPLVNRGRLLNPDGTSELSDLLPVFDAISKLATDLMVTSEFHASPRRYATGVQLPEKVDPLTGEPTGEIDGDAFSPIAGRTWIAENADVRFGEFSGSDLSGFTNAIESLTSHLAALSGLPAAYFGLTTTNPASADAIRSSEATLVQKARRRQRAWGGAWEEAMRLAVAIRDGRFDPRLNRLETVWRDPESRTVAQTADAMTKLVAAGLVPIEQALEDIGYSPTQIERMKQMRRAEALDRAALGLLNGGDA
jgi:hypothetical protein